ncbi:aldehyde dehydrogenase [Celeribacter ethanolicus]|uniref:Aldehyde dehydrogenase n=1 Tax=Celeribacter ethanolicus TaxID=1758178 RepID=A0A291GDJ2_9RHOB|nr:cytochrome c [Celeribacter ethanolicus]ATG48265.1 aldehyde dehydrogenase [Celeribacter ethanolicus]
MIKRIFTGGVALAALGIAGFAIYAWHPAIDPVATPPADSFAPAQIEQGRILAAAGYCATCHTAADGAPYAGNYPMKTDFGTIYSTNITPDRETGIGAWSEEAFERAMREGLDRSGAHLFPALPFDHFTKMSDEDISALYAYIMSSVPAVAQEHRDNDLPFPLDQRFLQAGWKMLFFDEGRYEPDPAKSEEWNRGAYLVEGVTHCGACHTPRNALGAEETDEMYAGAAIDDWIAPPLTAANPSGVAWTSSAFFDYLKTGSSRYHGGASGPMAPVVHAGLRELPDSDLRAISVYLGDIVGAPDEDPATNPAVIKSLEAGIPQQDYRANQGERLYATACASCHYNSQQIAAGRPDLGINSAMRLDDPTNLIHVMLEGVKADQGMEGVVMPAFGSTMSDEQIAAIAAYLRSTRTDKAPWADLEQKVADIRALGAAAH